MSTQPSLIDKKLGSNVSAPEELKKAQDIANVLDTAVRVPVLGINLGLDFLIGLIPGIGDATMFLAALRIVYLGKKMGAPEHIQSKMLRNAMIDFGFGFIPIFGDLMDIFYKANRANVRLLERWWIETHKAEVDSSTANKLAEWEAKMVELEMHTESNAANNKQAS